MKTVLQTFGVKEGAGLFVLDMHCTKVLNNHLEKKIKNKILHLLTESDSPV